MKASLFFISIISIGVISCDNKNVDLREKHNILGMKGGVTKVISDPENNNKQPSFLKEAMELNEQAVLLINNRNMASYHEAIMLLDNAIGLDSTYFMAYANKATVFTLLGEYDQAIETYNYIVTKVKRDYAEAFSMLALLNDKVGNEMIARRYYEKAIRIYSKRIHDKGDVWDMVNRAHLKYILAEEAGLNEIDSLISVYPLNEELPMFKEHLFLNYDHQKTLDDL